MKIGYQEESKFKIGDIGKIYRTLAKNLYKHPLTSAIIEIVSNSRDSMVKVGKENDPVFLHYDGLTNKIHIRDEGEGMSPEFMKTNYIDIGWSSKGNDPNAIGQFGIGKLSPLAYTSSYEVVTRWNGIESKYLISENEEGTPDFDEIYSVPTDCINGTEVIFQLKNTSSSWYNSEKKEVENIIKHKLPFFHNLIVTGLDVPNDYKIYEYKHFKTTNTIYNRMCILHGNCLYPIDNSVVKTKYLNIPVCLSFDIQDPIKPTPDRSGLQWNRDVIKLVQDKIDLAEKELEDLYIEQNKTDNIIEHNFHNKDLKLGECFFKLPGILNTNLYIGDKFNNYFYLFNYFKQSDLFPIRRYQIPFKQSSAYYNVDKSYLIDKKDINKYKNYFTDKYFITYPELDEKFNSILEDQKQKNVDDKVIKHLNEDFLIFKKYIKDYIDKYSKSPVDLVIDKARKVSQKTNRNGQFYGKMKYNTYRWFNISDLNKHIVIYTTSLDEFDRFYPRDFPYLTLYYIKENHEKRLTEVGIQSLREHFSSKRYEKAFNRWSLRNDLCLLLDSNLVPVFSDYNYSFWDIRKMTTKEGRQVRVLNNYTSKIRFIENFQKDYYYKKIKENILDNINPDRIEYKGLYHYLYLKLKNKNVQSKIN